MKTERSPWWYRERGIVFLVLYVLAFTLGSWLWTRSGAEPQATFAWLAERTGLWARLVLALAAVATVICWALRAWGSAYLSPTVVWNPDARTDVLYVDGPFRFVRNPLYLGNVFLALGIGALATPCGFGIVVLGTIVFASILSAYEARGMQARFGSAFEAYRRAVPALIPRLTPAHVDGALRARPSLVYGLRSEILTGALALGTIVAAVAPSRGAAPVLWFWIAGFLTQVILALRERRETERS